MTIYSKKCPRCVGDVELRFDILISHYLLCLQCGWRAERPTNTDKPTNSRGMYS